MTMLAGGPSTGCSFVNHEPKGRRSRERREVLVGLLVNPTLLVISLLFECT